MIAAFQKSYNQTLEYVLYDISYLNVKMYSSVLPSETTKKENDFNEKLDANVPGRFNSGENETVVRR